MAICRRLALSVLSVMSNPSDFVLHEVTGTKKTGAFAPALAGPEKKRRFELFPWRPVTRRAAPAQIT
ncbi:hypothetical protein BOSE62_130056 [Bosea sp. 62]|nr:hypothetical protein BOSE7B_120056 [Bosea sp. 7B]CAD5280702.1 hypothetical protein BOSE21B_30860 [Bosea sp. 21B]CAD5281837.1 hypothetical protein BOSE46_40495 [Bosea sp. 46]VVT59401.1 hypothetical protein BOS5A_210192 [Bosea sp. EC-HK365B]VXB27573.1 hypothetical protein BOSE62_130056 [Bosea sp. 62]VXB89822.1 hypothetical protein BOSE127_160086 [Bosea sp. 127]VXC38066.1 hypothetical protein BOSE29B_30823 [Bosea sp. 29B]VXC82434.1 hypothetical protein BOSE125_50496 [Bosea sp. 125]